MLVADVIATPVRVPLRTPLRTALGTAQFSEYGIVQVIADDGTTGLGEVSMIWHGNGSRLCREINELVRPAILGMPVNHRSVIVATAEATLQFGRHSRAAIAAIDMALLDLVGRHYHLSATDLLGGPRRERVRLSMSLSIATVAAVVGEARNYLERGFTALKIKGDHDLAHVIETAAALREAFGDQVDLRVDLNMAAPTPKAALLSIRQLADLGVISVEQPLPAGDLNGAAFLVENSPIPIMLDESVWTAADAWAAIQTGACDMVNVYVAEAGGPSAARRLVDLCDLAGVDVAIGSMPELAIGTAAAATVAFTAPRLTHPSDVCGYLYHRGDVVHHDLHIQDGYLHLPTGPGLGVELDPAALREFRWEGADRG